MSAKTADPNELRPLIHRQIDDLPADELALVSRMLAQLEMHRLLDDVGQAADDARTRGELTPGKIDAAIRDFRARQPYR